MTDRSVFPEVSLRDLAIESALIAIVRHFHPRAQCFVIVRGSNLKVQEGSGEYFLEVDGRLVARVRLNGPDDFSIKILE